MLVLTRDPGQKIIVQVPGLATPITIKVLEIKGQHVRVGIDATPEVSIMREEALAKDGGSGKRLVKPPQGRVEAGPVW